VLQVIDEDGKVINDFIYPDNFVLRRLSSDTDALDMEVSMCLIEDYGCCGCTTMSLQKRLYCCHGSITIYLTARITRQI